MSDDIEEAMLNRPKRFVAGWFFWFVLLMVGASVIFGGLRAVGLIGQTAVERMVFEQSYQRQAGDNAKLNTFLAEKAALESLLRSQSITDAERADYQAQLSAINIQINSLERQ